MIRYLLIALAAISIFTGCETNPMHPNMTDQEWDAMVRKRWRLNTLKTRDKDIKAVLYANYPDTTALIALRTRLLAEIKSGKDNAPISALAVAEIQANLLAIGAATPEESLALCQRMTDLIVAKADENNYLRLRVAQFWSQGWILPRDTARISRAFLAMSPKGESQHNHEAAWAAWYFPKVEPTCAPLFAGKKFTDASNAEQHTRSLGYSDELKIVEGLGAYELPFITDDNIYKASIGRAESTPEYQKIAKLDELPRAANNAADTARLTTLFQLGLTPPLTRETNGSFSLPASPTWITPVDPKDEPTIYNLRNRAYLATLLKAEKAGNARAIFLLAILSDREGFEPFAPRQSRPSLADSTGRLGRAAELGDPNAQSLLGEWLYKGDGVPHDVPRAIKLWFAASKAGDARAKALLEACVAKGLPGHELAEELAKAEK